MTTRINRTLALLIASACLGALGTAAAADTGACCFGGGECAASDTTTCTEAGGIFTPDATCAEMDCPEAGACCFSDGECITLFAADCATLAGVHQGDHVDCLQMNCGTSLQGECCFPDGTCQEIEPGECTAQGGEPRGGGNCIMNPCPQPGACCLPDGSCQNLTPDACSDQGGTAPGGSCIFLGTICPQPGACCLPNDTCVQNQGLESASSECANMGGQYQGDGSDCQDQPCISPDNDECENAIRLESADAISGTVEGATDDPVQAAACFINLPHAGVSLGPGVWYSVLGTGNEIIASLCPEFSNGRLMVFCGDCLNPTCVADSGDQPDVDLTGFCPDQQVNVQWCSQLNREYLILVVKEDDQGPKPPLNGGSNFDLFIGSSSDEPCIALEDCGPANDECEGAIELAIPSTTMSTVAGSNPDPELFQCSEPTSAPLGGPDGGVWYAVTGTGNTITASTCSDFGALVTVAVFCGPCDNLNCIDLGFQNCLNALGGNPGEVSFCSEAGVTYYILVHNSLPIVDLTPLGGGPEFTLDISDDGVACQADNNCPAPNDDCEDAIFLASPEDEATGTLANATPDPEAIPCFVQPEFASGGPPIGVWYTIEGDGTEFTATGSFGNGIAVFCGPCEALTCVDIDSPNQLTLGGPNVTWCTIPGLAYRIFVFADGEGGEYNLLVDSSQMPCNDATECPDDIPPPNDDCETAQTIIADESQTSGTVAGAEPDDEHLLCLDENLASVKGAGDPGVWYSVIGNGTLIRVQLVPDNFEVAYRLSVFCGPCDNLICLGSAEQSLPNPDLLGNDITVSFCSEVGVEYRILVQRRGGQNADDSNGDPNAFTIEADPGPPCDNAADCSPLAVAADECEDAEPVCPGTQYFDDTFDATPSSLIPGFTLDCGAAFGLVDVWYEYTPRWTGDAFFSISGVNNSHTQWVLAVYTDCAGHEDDMILCLGGGIIAPAPVVRGETYYIRIARLINDVGEFRFQIFGPECLNLEGDFNDDGIVDDEQCLSDVNGDNTVNAEDFLDILFNFGDCPNNAPCPRDVTFDGIIDQQDLAQVFEDFGECLLNPLGDDDRPKEFDALDVRGR